jgi:hypothetical protein
MLREPNLTDGIGARTARNIPFTSTKGALIDRILIFVTSAKQKKTTKIAQPKEHFRIAKMAVGDVEWGFGNISISEIKYYLSNVAFPL